MLNPLPLRALIGMADLPPVKPQPLGRREGGSDLIARMEQKRLEQPCLRTLDLRLRMQGRCREYRYQNRTHYLDDESIAVFEAAVGDYAGHYTIGVFERVTNSAHLQTTELKTRSVAAPPPSETDEAVDERDKFHSIQFGYRPHRAESRLNYVSTVTMELANGARIIGKTSDVSLLGVRLHLPLDSAISVGIVTEVTFDELETRSRSKYGSIAYTIVGIDKEPGRLSVRVKRLMRGTEREFDRFLPNFIDSMSTRYKLELKDALPATYARIYEQMYAQCVQYLHGYYGLHDGKLEFLFCAGDLSQSYLEKLPLSAWLAKQLARLVLPADLSALEAAPQASPQRMVALALGSRLFALPSELLRDTTRRADWLTLCENASATAAFSLVWRSQPVLDERLRDNALELLPESLAEDARLWTKRIALCTHSCAIVPVRSALVAAPKLENLNADVADWLLPYEIPTTVEPVITGMGLRGARTRERYLYQTKTIVNFEQQSWPGETVDFSINGLQVKLDLPASVKQKDMVNLSFPTLMGKIKTPSELENQPYKVMHILRDGHVLCLERDFRVTVHTGARFFAQIIQNNQNRLPVCSAEQLATSEAMLAEQMLAFGLVSIPLFLARDADKRPNIQGLAFNAKSSLLTPYMQGKKLLLSSLNQRDVLHDLLAECTNNVGYVDRIKRCELVWLRNDKTGQDRWFVFDEKITAERRMKLLLDGLPTGRVTVFAVHVMPHPNIDRNQLEQDLQPILRNSRYKADVLRAELNHMVGIAELFDITPGLIQELKLIGALS